jgi:hypothetical protein
MLSVPIPVANLHLPWLRWKSVTPPPWTLDDASWRKKSNALPRRNGCMRSAERSGSYWNNENNKHTNRGL